MPVSYHGDLLMPVTIANGSIIDYDGSGPPLLLIAGVRFGRWTWFKQTPELSRRFETITYDLRDLGRSGAENLTFDIGNLALAAAALLDESDV